MDAIATMLKSLRAQHRRRVSELSNAIVALAALKAEREVPGDPTRHRVVVEESKRARDRVSRIRVEVDITGMMLRDFMGRRADSTDRTGNEPSDLRRRSSPDGQAPA